MSRNPILKARWEAQLRDYARERLLPQMHLEGKSFDVVEPDMGATTFIRLLKVESGAGFAVRAYGLLDRWRLKKRLAAEQILERNELPAPRLLDVASGSLWGRPAFTAEERMEGTHLDAEQWTPERAERLADALAVFHAVSSESHGPVHRLAHGSYFQACRRRGAHRLSGIRRRAQRWIDRGRLNAVESWLDRQAERFAGIRRFDLQHDKLNAGNLLWQDSPGRFVFLDFETLQFGSRAKDLVHVEHDVLFEREAIWAAFRQRYLSRISDEDCERAEALEPFFHAQFHLSEAAIALKRLERRGGPSQHARKRFMRHWEAVEEIVVIAEQKKIPG